MKADNYISSSTKPAALAALLCAAVFGFSSKALAQETTLSFDGLEPVPDARVAMAYIDPEADFTVFKRVVILEPYVAFRSSWLRDQNRSRTQNVRQSDMDRIKADVAALFKEVFTESLEADDGFPVVEEGGEDVLIIRPAIIDLDVTAPDVQRASRQTTHVASAGAATLYIELFDSMTGDIIGRAADRRAARRGSTTLTWSNRVTNSAEARRMFRRWADQLRSFLDSHYMSQ